MNNEKMGVIIVFLLLVIGNILMVIGAILGNFIIMWIGIGLIFTLLLGVGLAAILTIM